MNPRFAKLLLTALLLVLSLGLYGAHQYQGRAPGETGTDLQSIGLGASGPAVPDAVIYDQALARLDERLFSYPEDLEARLFKGLLYFKAGRLDEALTELDVLTHQAPQFHLAHLVLGDLLLSHTGTVSDIGDSPLLAGLDDRREYLLRLREEAEARLNAYLDSFRERRLPRPLLSLGDSVRTAFLVEKATHRLFIYEQKVRGEPPRLLRDFYVSTGKLSGNKNLRGDLRTPEGVYFITSHIPASRLPEKYGVGAYPMNYPNELDSHLGKTGGGIWLHGTEDGFYSRPPLDSEGCVVLPNLDLDALAPYIHPGTTPVIIADRVEWLERDEWLALRDAARTALEGWRRDWEGGDVDRYLSHYAKNFWSGRYDLADWSGYKRRVLRGKHFQHVALSDVSLLAYPRSASGGRAMVVANFRQSYRSNNFRSEMGKRLYLVREDGHWKVLYEGPQ